MVADAPSWSALEDSCYGFAWDCGCDWWPTLENEGCEHVHESVHDLGVIEVEASVATNYVGSYALKTALVMENTAGRDVCLLEENGDHHTGCGYGFARYVASSSGCQILVNSRVMSVFDMSSGILNGNESGKWKIGVDSVEEYDVEWANGTVTRGGRVIAAVCDFDDWPWTVRGPLSRLA